MDQKGIAAPFDLTIAYSNLSSDVISAYCFGESFNLLNQPGWGSNFRELNLALLKKWFLFRFFPFLKSLTEIGVWYAGLKLATKTEMVLLTNLHRFIDYLPEDTARFIRTMQIDIPKMVIKTTEDLKAGIVYPRPIFVKALMDSSLSKEEKSPERIYAEVLGILGAGTETTAW